MSPDVDDPIVNPDCRAGKHRACSGRGWDLSSDQSVPCLCSCHHGGA